MHPARSRLTVLSAAVIAAVAAVLAVVLPAGNASAAGRPAAENRVWAISLPAHDHVRADQLVSAGERLGEPAWCPFWVSGACVAAEEQQNVCTVGGQSFTGKTNVLTAAGVLVAISKLRVGEKVIATNTKTGKTTAETVVAVLVHHDTDKYDLKVSAGGKTSVIDTTSSHLFWDQDTRRWVKAGALKYGTHLRTPGSGNATVTGGWAPRQATGWMWDLTITIDHDFYIQAAGSTAVLVHNICVQFGQRRIGPNFSTGGAFRGRSIYAVAQDLKNGVLDPNGVKVNVFEQDGQLVAENNRSLAALSLAGLEPTNVNVSASASRDGLGLPQRGATRGW